VSALVLDRRPAGPSVARDGRRAAAEEISIRAMGVAPGMRGRAAEIAVLDDALDRAASGRLAIVLVDGEAGIGKTRLLEAALEAARGRGLRVAAGRAAELARTRSTKTCRPACAARCSARPGSGSPRPGRRPHSVTS
jgi:predicted ATP-dependent serine protease